MTAVPVPVVLVLDADQRSALAAARSLGGHGLRVLSSGAASLELAGTSRYSTSYLQSPSPANEPSAFMAWLQATVREMRVSFLLPVTEVTSQLVLKHRDQIAESCVVPFADLATVMRLADKGNLVRLASELGVPCPCTQFVDSAAAFNTSDVAEFPVVLKPRQSRVDLGTSWLSTAVAVAHSRRELEQLLRDRAEFREHPFLLQEFVPGSGAGVFALYDYGREIATFAHKRLREKPPAGGVSVLSESSYPTASALEISRKLLGRVRWHGVAMVEIRITPDGQPYLMEVNTRLWGSLQLAIDAGVDFPWLLYQVCTGQTPGALPPYVAGRRLRWWLGDLDSLYLYLRDPAVPVAAKLRRVAAFLTPDPGRTRHEVFRWDDPAPAWHELKAWVVTIAR